jgi:HD-like signal output (HDOD) protein
MTIPPVSDAIQRPEVQEAVDRFVARILADLKGNSLRLPTLPPVVVRVHEAVESVDGSAARIARIVSADATLASRLIQIANSAIYHGQPAVENVQMAITRLGDRAVRGVIMSLGMRQLFQTGLLALRARVETLWLHSAEVAALSAVLARRAMSLSVDEAMLAGLVHDIGALPLIAHAEEYPVLLGHPPALEPVIERLHGPIGRLILETWQFPPEIVEVASEHEDLGRYSARVDYTDIVTVANLHSYLGKPHRLARVNWDEVPAFGKLGLTPEQSLMLFQQTREEIAGLRKILQG